MEIAYEKTGPCTGKLSVTVPPDVVDATFSRVYKGVARRARVPGFRPGKAPRQVIDAHYGAQVRSEVESELVQVSLHKALAEKAVLPVATPRVASGELRKGNAFSYTAELETQPEITLQTYRGLKVPPLKVELSASEVDAELDKLRQQSMQLAPVLDRDNVQDGDLVLADYHATEGGMMLAQSSVEGGMLEIGHDFIPGLSAALLGARVPGARQVPVDFPADFQIEAWRGKKVTFHVTLKELKKRDLPTLDDDFAKDLGEENLAALRGKIESNVRSHKEESAKTEQRRALLQSLIDANPFDVPPSLIAEQVDRMIIDAATRVRQMMGDRFSLGDLEMDKLRLDNRPLAEFQVRSGLLLLEVAKDATIDVSDADIDTEIARIAESAGEQGERVRIAYQNEQNRHRLRYRLLEDKTVALLMQHAATQEG